MRSSTVKAISVASVLLTGSFAIAANIGILNAADNGNLGVLSADLASAEVTQPQIIEVKVEDFSASSPVTAVPSTDDSSPTTQPPPQATATSAPSLDSSMMSSTSEQLEQATTTTSSTAPQIPAAPTQALAYAAGDAGVVRVVLDGSTISVSSVEPSPGWTHSIDQDSSSSVKVSFTNGSVTYDFTLAVGADGVPVPSVTQRAATPSVAPPSRSDDDDHFDDRGGDREDRDDRDDDDDEDESHHEGGDDDD